jgi:hypothetical protein
MVYNLQLSGPNDEVIEATITGEGTLGLTVTLGQWRIDARGWYLEALAGTGSVSFTVVSGANSIRVPMSMSGPYYGITVDSAITGGTVESNFTAAFAGTPITVEPEADPGHGLKTGTLKYNDGTDHVVSGPPYTFTMPASDITIGAEFEPFYRVTEDSPLRGGSISADPVFALAGTVITLTVTPDTGCILDDGTVKYRYGGSNYTPGGSGLSYTFTMPASDVTVSAEFVNLIRYVTETGSGDGLSWANASGDLQAMMDELAALYDSGLYPGPFVVKAAAGTYTPKYKPKADGTSDLLTPANDRDSAFILREGVQVRGGYPASGGEDSSRNNTTHETILSGDIDGDGTLSDNAHHVVVGIDIPAGSGTVLDGLTISGGNANQSSNFLINGNTIFRNYGGGMYNISSSPVLTDVTISGNTAGGDGGGMYNITSSPALTSVTISGNTAGRGGGMFNDSSRVTLNGGSITGNTAGNSGNVGGGMFNISSSPVLTNVTISGNSAAGNGGGMCNITSSSPVLTNVTISGNTAGGDGGGMFNASSSPVLINVIVSGNSALHTTSGGGMGNTDSTCLPVLINVTIAGNSGGATGAGGMTNHYYAKPEIRNSVIWGNAGGAPGIQNFTSATPLIRNSIVQGSSGSGAAWSYPSTTNGGGNAADPGTGAANSPFADWKDPGSVTMPNSDGDYRLAAGSPAIDAGDNTWYPASTADSEFMGLSLSAEARALIDAALAKDLDGNTRKNGAIDMGAYEKQ